MEFLYTIYQRCNFVLPDSLPGRIKQGLLSHVDTAKPHKKRRNKSTLFVLFEYCFRGELLLASQI